MYLAPKGYSVVIDGWGIETREDTFTCGHGGHVVFVPAGRAPEHRCKKCYLRVCERCYGGECDVYEAKLDRIEATDAWLRERFEHKYAKASAMSEQAAIEVQLRKRQMLKDMGF